ncbi:Hypothetical predicted protein [Mytilus galloprovincialis]|uniref:Uncharacterized protein n=1 Tax=Mytilus galloprovincialis TaxID=29158 RepID=A0A8B6E6L1_MYTGA|nr:Hypothetical predicted protein [Mytilus galloprovincialis]
MKMNILKIILSIYISGIITVTASSSNDQTLADVDLSNDTSTQSSQASTHGIPVSSHATSSDSSVGTTHGNTTNKPYITDTTENPDHSSVSTAVSTSGAPKTSNPSAVPETSHPTTVPDKTTITVQSTSGNPTTTRVPSSDDGSGFSGLSFGLGILGGVIAVCLSILLVFLYRRRIPYETLSNFDSTSSINFLKD